jgi:plasmid stability protein
MPVNLSIKNAPDDVVQRLRERAAKNHRSLQGELLAIIEDAISPGKISPLQLLAELRSANFRTDDDSVDIIRADRNRDDHR